MTYLASVDSGSRYDVDATAYFNRTTGMFEDSKKDINDLIVSLKQLSIWDELDVLCVAGFGLPPDGEANALLNMVKDEHNATVFGSPSYTPDQGWHFLGSAFGYYIDTNFVPVAGVTKYDDDSVCLMAYYQSGAIPFTATFIGHAYGAAAGTYLYGGPSNTRLAKIQAAGTPATVVQVSDINGGIAGKRDNSADYILELDDEDDDTATESSSALDTVNNLYVGARNDRGTADQFYTGQISAWGIGSGNIDLGDFIAAIEAYFVARGTEAF